jgi:type I restriction enzyme, S subunit
VADRSVGLRCANPTYPAEWRDTTWGNIATLEYGKAIRDYQNATGSVPVFGTNGPIGWHHTHLCPSAGVVIGRKGAYRGIHYSSRPFFVIDTAFYLKPKEPLDTKWAYYCLLTYDINGMDSGSAIPSTSRDEFYKLPVRIPRLAEQQQIAKTLSALDDRITLLRETNATLEAIAQALFKSWFVDFDPVHTKQQGLSPDGMDEATAALFPDGFEESELGLVPRGWRVAPILDVVEGVYDGPHATPSESDQGPIFLGIKNLTGTALDFTDVRHIHEDQWAQWTRRVTPHSGDIVFSYEATLGFFALIPPETRCCLGRRLALIRPLAEEGCGHFWFHQFISARFQRLLEKHTIQGATVNRIPLKHFPNYPVLAPPDTLRALFESVVAPLWAKIHSNQAHYQALASLRDTLLPRLISGQLRLPEVEAQL